MARTNTCMSCVLWNASVKYSKEDRIIPWLCMSCSWGRVHLWNSPRKINTHLPQIEVNSFAYIIADQLKWCQSKSRRFCCRALKTMEHCRRVHALKKPIVFLQLFQAATNTSVLGESRHNLSVCINILSFYKAFKISAAKNQKMVFY